MGMTLPPALCQMKSLTEHAVAARIFADEIERTNPDTTYAHVARGESIGWRHALILMGGTMPDPDGTPCVAPVCSNPTCGHRHDHHGHAPGDRGVGRMIAERPIARLARCPVCDGPVWYTQTGSVSCLKEGRAHLYIPRAQQRVQAGETLADVIAGEVEP